MTSKTKTILSAVGFLLLVAAGTYWVFAIEALTQREIDLVDQLEESIANALDEDRAKFFPPAGRLPSKFQMGGTPPAVYKLQMTTGRRGRRLTFDLSIKRTAEKAGRKFEGRWKHELRANRLGNLEAVALSKLDPANSRLAHIKNGLGEITGVFFLAHRGRGMFGLTLKGISLAEFKDFEGMLAPTLATIEQDGPMLMLE